MTSVGRIDIAELRRLYTLATPGEWEDGDRNDHGDHYLQPVGRAVGHIAIVVVDELGLLGAAAIDNINLIVAAHNTLPVLLAELERLYKLEAGLLGAILSVGNAMNGGGE